MKNRVFLLMCFVAAFYSCDIQKKAIKNKTDRVLNEQIETITKRKGDTVTFTVPKVVYKDTTIIKKNYVTGTTQVLRYDSQGRVDLAQCISGAIEQMTRSNKELIEAITSKEREKTEAFDSSVILYGFVGLGVLLVMLFGFGIVILKKYLKPL